jgi:voltage-gated sodium channel
MEDIIHPGGKNIKELHRDDAFLVQQINSKHGGIALDSLLVNPEKKIAVRRNSKSPQTFEAKLEFYRDFLKAKKISVKSRGQVLYQYYTQEYIRPAAHSEEFSQFVTFIIIVASILVGVQTYDLSEGFTLFLNVVDAIILAIFTFEVVFKIAAEGCSPLKYFGDSWQVFDFVVVVFCYIPEVQAHATMLRLLRLLRVLKVLKAFPELNVIVKSITSSLPSLGYISLLIMLLFYLFGIIAVLWFGANDPHHFGSLHVAILSLWRSATGEDWTELMYTAMYGCDAVEAQGGYYGDGIAGSKCTDNQSSYAIVSTLEFSF